MGGEAVKPEDLHKLLGGYAAGALTQREREELFRGALEDQALFDALVKEDALRDLLSERAARAELLAALEERRGPLAWFGWLRRPAAALATAGALAVAVLVLAIAPRPAGRVEMAKVEIPAPPGAHGDRVLPSLPAPVEEGAARTKEELQTDSRSRAVATPPLPLRERDAAPRVPSAAGPAEQPQENLAEARPPAFPDPSRAQPGAPPGEAPQAAALGTQENVRMEAETRGEALMVGQATPPPAAVSHAPTVAGGPAPGQPTAEAVSTARSGVTPTDEATESRGASPRFQASTAAGAEAAPLKEQLATKKTEPASWRILAVSGNRVTIEPVPDRPLVVGARLSVWRGVSRIGELTVTRVSPAGTEAEFQGPSRPRPGDFARPIEPAGSGYNRR
jgi:hypothetical protein